MLKLNSKHITYLNILSDRKKIIHMQTFETKREARFKS